MPTKMLRPEVLGVRSPSKDCLDWKCPFHGRVTVKRELFRGRVVKKDTRKSATIEWHRPFLVSKYERYETRRSRMRVHNPSCIDAQVGEEVLVARTKPLSKTKNHIILKVTAGAVISIKGEDVTDNTAKDTSLEKDQLPKAASDKVGRGEKKIAEKKVHESS